ncbi:unnamed protein product [Orchesella dallaii]|uniref:Ionotropic glutamate receptor C-terminal domain-containing protein n=1 Tax=Orchesella dallaii TaxID=48710 RepID=A0ABP1RKG3_9HEXA
MRFIGARSLLLFVETLVLMPCMKNLDNFSWTSFSSSSSSATAAVVAFDMAVLSNALDSFTHKGGDKHSFDLIICLQHAHFSDLGHKVLRQVSGFTAQIANCSNITPPPATDLRPTMYILIPRSKMDIGDVFEQISRVYQLTKMTFYSTRSAQLLWMPFFLVLWPDSDDYCGDDLTSQTLIRASIADERALKTFSVDSDVYMYFGSDCDGDDDAQHQQHKDNVWEMYVLKTELITQKLSPDGRKYEPLYDGILGRVRRRMNLNRLTIRAIASRDPSSFLEKSGWRVFDPLEIVDGTPRVVFRELQQALNFSDETINSDWIRAHKNGSLKGKTAELFRMGMADLFITPASLLPYRKVELSFLQPTYSNSVNGFFVQPAASSLRDIVISPFSFGLWVSLMATYLILIASILFFGRQYRNICTAMYEEFPENDMTLGNEVLLWAVGAVTQQGWYIYPKSNSTRMAFTLGYSLGLVCYGAFSAAVVAILAVEMIPIKSRSDLLNSSLTFYADNASSTMAYVVDYLQTHTSIRFGNRVNIKEGVSRLKSKEPSCYVAFPHYFYLSAATINISESWICNHLSVISVTTGGTPSSMVVPRDSPYAELMNFMILKMISRGLNYRYVHLYNEATTWKCSKDSSQVFHPLGLNDVFTAGFILFAAIVISFALLVVEKTYARRIWKGFKQTRNRDKSLIRKELKSFGGF